MPTNTHTHTHTHTHTQLNVSIKTKHAGTDLKGEFSTEESQMLNLLSHLGNTNPNDLDIPSFIHQNGENQKCKWQLKLMRIWSKVNMPPLMMGVPTCTTTSEINMVVSQKIGNRSTSKPSYNTFGHIPKGNSILPQWCWLSYVHISFIHNNQKLEAA
jgi:hypothetical protein